MRMLYKLQNMQSQLIDDQRTTRKELLQSHRKVEAGQTRVEQELQQVALEVKGRMDQVEAKVDGLEARLSVLEARPETRSQSAPPGPRRNTNSRTMPDFFESRVFGLGDLEGEVKMAILNQLIQHEALARFNATIDAFHTQRGPRIPILKFDSHVHRSAFHEVFEERGLGKYSNGDLVVQFNIKKVMPNEEETKVLRNVAYFAHQHLQDLGTTRSFINCNLFKRNLSFFGVIVAYYVGVGGGTVNFGETGIFKFDKKAVGRALEGKSEFNFDALLTFLNQRCAACTYQIE